MQWFKFRVFPIRHANYFDGKGFGLPNNEMFSTYDPHLPLLLSGNKHQWNEIASVFINSKPENDALLFHNLMRNNNKISIEDSLIQSKKFLESKNCIYLENKIGMKLSISTLDFEKKAKMLKSMTSLLQTCKETTNISLEKCKPTIHTFFELDDKLPLKTLWTQLDEWILAWKEAGWNTVVLNLNDAKKHPLYEKFRQAFDNAPFKISKNNQMTFYRWLAMATLIDGGWMSDYDNFPLNLHHYASCHLHNNGIITTNEGHIPSLASGSKSEWERMSQLLLSSYQLNHNIYWNDVSALEDIYKNHGTNAYIQTKDSISIYNVYSKPPTYMRTSYSYSQAMFIDVGAIYNSPFDLKQFCHSTSKKSVHFSYESCNKAKFCNNDRGPIFTKWLTAWKKDCLNYQK